MFVVDVKNTFKSPVEFNLPGDGEPIVAVFVAEFKRLPQSRIDAIVTRTEKITDDALVREVLDGWDDEIKDAEGKPLPFTPENLDRVLEVNGVRKALAAAFVRDSLDAGSLVKN
jgi:hypothetical protein